MWKSLACALLLPTFASAADMSRVPVGAGFCKGNDESFCFEWAVSSVQNLRFVAHGDEDGIEYRFYRADHGSYELVADVFPVLQDAAHPHTLFWAYPWDIADIKIVSLEGEPAILATRQHQLKVRDVFGMAVSDEVRQAVLFTGTTTQPEITVEMLPFKPLLLSRLGNDG
jgi:hypothetical protein